MSNGGPGRSENDGTKEWSDSFRIGIASVVELQFELHLIFVFYLLWDVGFLDFGFFLAEAEENEKRKETHSHSFSFWRIAHL